MLKFYPCFWLVAIAATIPCFLTRCAQNSPKSDAAIDCTCTIPPLDQLVEHRDSSVINLVGGVELTGEIAANAKANKLISAEAQLGIESVDQISKEISNSYIGKSDFRGNKSILELAIARNIFCATLVTYCKTGNINKMESEAQAFKQYMLEKLKQAGRESTKKVGTTKMRPNITSCEITIETGSYCQQVLFNNQIVPETIKEGTTSDTKTFSLPVGRNTYCHNSVCQPKEEAKKHPTE